MMHKFQHVRHGRALVVAALGATLAIAAACSTDTAFSPTGESATLFWKVRLNQHAVQLNLNDAAANSYTLIATATTPGGTPWAPQSLGDSATIRWISTDSSRVRVSATGVVTAITAGPGTANVIIRQTVRNVTRSDTCRFRVLSEAPRVLTSLSFFPENDDFVQDSINLAQGETKFGVTLIAKDAANQQMTGVVGYITSSDTTIAKPNFTSWTNGGGTISILGQRVGTALMTATTFVYGVQMTDTFRIHIGYPIHATASVFPRKGVNGAYSWLGSGFTQDVGPGAVVQFENGSKAGGAPGQLIDVTFDDPSAALPALYDSPTGSGNISALPADTGYVGSTARIQYRRFDAVGTYPFHVPQYHIDGVITVKPTP